MTAIAPIVVLRDLDDFTIANFAAVSRAGAGVRIDPDACMRIGGRRAAFMRFIDASPAPWVYGVTGQITAGAAVTFTREQRRANTTRAISAGAVLYGEALPERIVRGAVFCRLANFIEGHAAVRAEVAIAVAAMLDGPLPSIPRFGHGAAGEMLLLSPLFGGLIDRLVLEEKEASALVNGAPVAAALLADTLLRSGPRLVAVIEAVAAAIAAYRAPLAAYDPALGSLWRSPHADCAASLLAAAVRRRATAGESGTPQAPVSFRAAPRLLARALRTYAAVRTGAERALAAVTDNPLVVAANDTVRVLSNGGFFDADAPALFDENAAVSADLVRLLEKLAARLGEIAGNGVRSRAGQARLRALLSALTGYAEDAAARASRTPLPATDGGSDHQNDLLSPVIQAWTKEVATSDMLVVAVATLHAIAACVDNEAIVDAQQLDGALRARMESATALAPEFEALPR